VHAHHYSPEFGRFIQPDPAAAEENLYAYAANSPTTTIDPSGESGLTAGRPLLVGWSCHLAPACARRAPPRMERSESGFAPGLG
jgi:uncharacterized protein RhaS with RHS repeats